MMRPFHNFTVPTKRIFVPGGVARLVISESDIIQCFLLFVVPQYDYIQYYYHFEIMYPT